MSRIPLTPGCKERVSANAGRIYAALVNLNANAVAEDTMKVSRASVDGALEIERAVTDALTPDED